MDEPSPIADHNFSNIRENTSSNISHNLWTGIRSLATLSQGGSNAKVMYCFVRELKQGIASKLNKWMYYLNAPLIANKGLPSRGLVALSNMFLHVRRSQEESESKYVLRLSAVSRVCCPNRLQKLDTNN